MVSISPLNDDESPSNGAQARTGPAARGGAADERPPPPAAALSPPRPAAAASADEDDEAPPPPLDALARFHAKVVSVER